MVILVDDEGRENEGDLVIAAQMATPQTINFMAQHGRGLICLAITPERATTLQLKPMADRNGLAFAFLQILHLAHGMKFAHELLCGIVKS